MNVGDYVKTKDGRIGKIMGSNAYDENKIAILIDDTKDIKITPVIDKEQIIKSSSNIIDLLEVGDYVNGIRVDEIKNGQLRTASYYDGYICHLCNEEDIKSIVTREMFESMEYKVGE